jgi:hypothetical protein
MILNAMMMLGDVFNNFGSEDIARHSLGLSETWRLVKITLAWVVPLLGVCCWPPYAAFSGRIYQRRK